MHLFDLNLPIELTRYANEILRKNLNYEVISCIQASKAKGIPLKNEIKTLLLSTSLGLRAAHLPGNKCLDHRKVKNALQVNDESLASPQVLNGLGISPGTVCVLREPVWSMKHLFSHELMDLEYISTNDGTRTGYFIFKPRLLLLSNKYEIGDYCR